MTDAPGIGSEIAGYRIDSLIGRGGMGVVYLAEHLRLKRKVALKVLAPELTGDQRFRERFIRESELAASLEHPSIVPIYDAGEADGLLYIAMRFIEGTDLKSLIEAEGALIPGLTAAVIAEVASALDAAHERGLVHRDVKPANILLDRSRRAYLTDFGLTKRRESVSGITRTGQFLGTVDYAAPEQFEGKPLDARTDVYSLGCVAFECLTGRVPFDLGQEVAVMHAHLHEPPPSPSALRPELGPGVDAAVRSAMAKSPSRRQDSTGAFAGELGDALLTKPGPGPKVAPGRGRRTRILWGGLAGAVAALIAVVAVVQGHGKGPVYPRPSAPSGAVTAAIAGGGSNVRIDPGTNTVVARAGSIGFVALGGGFVWVATATRLEKINPETGKVIASIDLVPDDMTFSGGSLWATTSGLSRNGFPITGQTAVHDSLYRIDPLTNKGTKLATLPDRALPFRLAFIHTMAVANGSVWVAIVTPKARGLLLRYDERTGKRLDVFTLSDLPAGIAFGESGLWIRSSSPQSASITRIDPRNGQVVKRFDVNAADGLAVGAGAVWVADSSDNVVVKIDPVTNTLAGQVSGDLSAPQATAAGDDRVWVVNLNSCSVARIDPATNRVVATIPLPPFTRIQLGTISDGTEGVWVGGFVPGPVGCS